MFPDALSRRDYDRWPVWRVEKGWKRGAWLKPSGEGMCVLCSSLPLRSQAGPGNGWDPRLYQHPQPWPDIRTHPPWAGPDLTLTSRGWCSVFVVTAGGHGVTRSAATARASLVLTFGCMLCANCSALCVCDALKRLKPRGAANLAQGHTTQLGRREPASQVL